MIQISIDDIGGSIHDSNAVLKREVLAALDGIEKEIARRGYSASNQLRNASQLELRGEGSGRQYRVPHTNRSYRASAPGESPAMQTGDFRGSWGTKMDVSRGSRFVAKPGIESKLRSGSHLRGDLLENGTRKMAARPYKQKIIDRAMPKIQAIYARPY